MSLIGSGFMLAALGMSVVFIFLVLLVIATSISSAVLSNNTARELAEIEAQEAAEAAARQSGSKRIIAAISAAMTIHLSQANRD